MIKVRPRKNSVYPLIYNYYGPIRPMLPLRDVHSEVRQYFEYILTIAIYRHPTYQTHKLLTHFSLNILVYFSRRRPLGSFVPTLLCKTSVLGCFSADFTELHTSLLPNLACRSISGRFQGVTLSIPISNYQFS